MKKLVFAMIAIAAFTFVSCGDPEPTGNQGECRIEHEGQVYIGPCDEIQRVIDENTPSLVE